MSSTSTMPRAFSGWRWWVGLFVGAFLLAAYAQLFTREPVKDLPLRIDNPKSFGSMALIEVVKRRGVAVTAHDDLQNVHTSPTTTTVLYDPDRNLPAADFEDFVNTAQGDVVIMGADARTVSFFDPDYRDIKPWYFAPGYQLLQAKCDVWDDTAPVIVGRPKFLSTKMASATVCFPPKEDVNSDTKHGVYLTFTHRKATIHLVAINDAFVNNNITNQANAAFALTLVGKHPTLHWVIPKELDTREQVEQGTDLTPDWVVPALLHLFLLFLMVWYWQGRRFGRVVWEQLPVVVSASEATTGLATLYRVVGAYERAAQLHRTVTASKVASLLGVPHSSDRRVLVDAIVTHTHLSHEHVESIFGRVVSSTDQLSSLLSDLKKLHLTVQVAVRPSKASPATKETIR